MSMNFWSRVFTTVKFMQKRSSKHDPQTAASGIPAQQHPGWYAGDILSTGTPRAFHIQDGDVAECRITGPDGFEMTPLVNPVVDLKKHPEKEA